MPRHSVKKSKFDDICWHDNACTCTHCLEYWEEHDKLYDDEVIPFDQAFNESISKVSIALEGANDEESDNIPSD